MPRPRKPLADRIRDEIARRGLNAYRVSKLTGLPPMTVTRFVNQGKALRLESIERLLDLLDWEVAPRKGNTR
jgi:hypothetical protein